MGYTNFENFFRCLNLKGDVGVMSFKVNYKKVFATAIISTIPFVVTQVCNSTIFAETSQTTTTNKTNDKSNDESTVKWGGSNWTLSSDGVLTLTDGDIGSAVDALSKVLTDAGIDPSQVTGINIAQATTASDIDYMIGNLPNLKNVTGIKNLNYSGSSKGMFAQDKALTTVDFTGFDTSKITNMNEMFSFAGFEKLDLSSFDTSNTRYMWAMFDGSTQLSDLNVKNFNTANVIDMGYMFYNIPAKTIDVSSFDTGNVLSMGGMFDATSGLETLDLSNFNTKKVTTMEYMFINSNVSKVDFSSFDTSAVTNMHAMFQNAKNIEDLNLSKFTISDATTTNDMMSGMSSLNQLELGKATQLKSDMNIPDVTKNHIYSGNWQNVGDGTIDEPKGEHVWSSSDLMNKFEAASMGDDTFVWQKVAKSTSTIKTGDIVDYKDDPNLTKYEPDASVPLNPYRYNVILGNDYPIYSKIEDGQTEQDNTVDLGDKTGATVYNKQSMAVTYSGGDQDGKSSNFVQISFDGKTWYWIKQDALNLDLKSRYPSTNKDGVALPKDMFLGSTITFADLSELDVNSQMVSNAFNPDGQIVYVSQAKESDFPDEDDPAAALKEFNLNLDKAAKSWNDAIGKQIFIKSTETDASVTLKVVVNPHAEDGKGGSATLYGNTGIYVDLMMYAMDHDHENYDINLLYITMRHELGHSLGLDHTSKGQYYGMPDGYAFGIDDDVMNAILSSEPTSWFPWTQKTITQQDIDAVNLIIQNHNFGNPHPEDQKSVKSDKTDQFKMKK